MPQAIENISYVMQGSASHTSKAYTGLDAAYSFFNAELFDNRLPHCLITFQRHKGSYGYFSPKRFSNEQTTPDEIALNPTGFDRQPNIILSTLVHEMCHLWQFHFGKFSGKHHNKQWGAKMKELGLYPSSTGAVGGKETGQKVSHYVIPNGKFEYACARFIEANQDLIFYVDNGQTKAAKKKNASKTKYTCPECEMNAWAKPDVLIQCVECDCRLIAEVTDNDD